jgi:spore coat polysaccharide biosynthesis protein SpsF
VCELRRVGAIIQARMNSSRLPGKVLLAAAGKPLLEHLMDRLRHSTSLGFAAIATSTEPADDPIAALCGARGIPIFRGSELDVLDRYYQAARHFQLDVVVRITSDCPLIDPGLVDFMVEFFLAHYLSYDLVTNRHPLTFPDGLDVDVMSMAGLSRAWRDAATPFQREHTIPYFWECGLRVYNVAHPDNLFARYRWTLDYWEDYLHLKQIFEALYSPDRLFTTDEIVAFLESHPEVTALNARYLPGSA